MPTPHDKLLLSRSVEHDREDVSRRIDAMALACERFDEPGLRDQLRALVPEFQEQD